MSCAALWKDLAARLAALRRADIAKLQDMVDAMRHASKKNRTADLVDADREFHLELCRISGNPHLVEHANRVLLPFFAFARIRIIASKQDTSAWDRDLEAHQRIADLIREGEGEVAEQYIRRAMARFRRRLTATGRRRRSMPDAKANARRNESDGGSFKEECRQVAMIETIQHGDPWALIASSG